MTEWQKSDRLQLHAWAHNPEEISQRRLRKPDFKMKLFLNLTLDSRAGF